jgi:nitrogen-specific signal transduction histidine kinase
MTLHSISVKVVGDTMRSLALRAHSKGLELAFRVETQAPNWLRGDVGRLRQIIVNLVGNAIKFTQQGEVVLNVYRADPEETADSKETDAQHLTQGMDAGHDGEEESCAPFLGERHGDRDRAGEAGTGFSGI